MSVRVRFAPSPTGYLHVGGARTALFNWLFARRQGGVFILRIEDTDSKRNDAEMVDGILEGMRWLGLDWDEGPFFQSERLALYSEASRRLIDSGHAYRDFSPPEDKSLAYRAFRDLDPAEAARRAEAGEPFAVRFKIPEAGTIAFEDLVYGRIEVAANTLEDFVITRSDGMPTYHLSVVADDAEMGISHVIRGADHLSNTGKHVLLFEALGRAVPLFAHLPMILGPDKKRLSKRHGATSVTEYSQMGLLPEAARNYLALLGWSPGDDAELLPGEALAERFDLSRVNRADAVFDPAKLEWLNKRYLSTLEAAALEPLVRTQLEAAGLWRAEWEEAEQERFRATIDLLKSRVQNLHDFPDYGRPFFTDNFEYEPEAAAKFLTPGDAAVAERLPRALAALREAYTRLEPFDLEQTEAVLRQLAAEFDLKAGAFIGAVRVAMTGRAQAPGIFEVLVTLGRQVTLARLDRALQYRQ